MLDFFPWLHRKSLPTNILFRFKFRPTSKFLSPVLYGFKCARLISFQMGGARQYEFVLTSFALHWTALKFLRNAWNIRNTSKQMAVSLMSASRLVESLAKGKTFFICCYEFLSYGLFISDIPYLFAVDGERALNCKICWFISNE